MEIDGLSRRGFLREAVRCGALVGGAGMLLPGPEALFRLLGGLGAAPTVPKGLDELVRAAPEARYWISTSSKEVTCASCHDAAFVKGAAEGFHHEKAMVRCQLCAQGCLIAPGERGKCSARINVDGTLRTLVYGRPITVHVDPVEKKPFYHFLPGSAAFSLATSGCPLRCKFCQNWEISQARPEDYSTPYRSPLVVAQTAVKRRAPILAFTYNEPTVFTEYLTDIAREGRKIGLRSVLISCGYMQEAPLQEMCEVLDGIKIDLKGFSKEFYRDVCGSELQPVLRSIKQVAASGTHLELVNLVVPTLNDSEKMLRELAKWVVGEVGPDVPVHFTRFHPDYQLRNLPPTPVATLERARDIALDRGVRYAFVGNVPGHPGNHTYCPKCGKVVIERRGFLIEEMHIVEGRCEHCQTGIAGVWH